jgi:hypothetical protein
MIAQKVAGNRPNRSKSMVMAFSSSIKGVRYNTSFYSRSMQSKISQCFTYLIKGEVSGEPGYH